MVDLFGDSRKSTRHLQEQGRRDMELIRITGDTIFGKASLVDYEEAKLNSKHYPDVVAGYKSAGRTIGELLSEQDAAEYDSNWNKSEACKRVINGLRDRAMAEMLSK